MHRNLHSPTKLTEFARDFDSEEPDSFFGKIVSRLTSAYNTSYNTVNVAPATSTLQLAAAVRKPVAMRPPEQPKNNVNTGGVSPAEATSSSSGSSTSLPLRTPPAVATAAADRPNSFASNNQRSSTPSSSCGRSISIDDMSAAERSAEQATPPSSVRPVRQPAERLAAVVISRIGSLMAVRSDSLTSYKDTELQRCWMPDAKAKECYECSLKFTTLRRKHHCRLCGQIFCARCCSQSIPGKIINCAGNLKVCTYCLKLVLCHLQSADLSAELAPELQLLQEDLATKLMLGRDGAVPGSTAGHTGAIGAGTDGAVGGVSGCGTVAEQHHEDAQTLAAQRKVSIGYQEERLVAMQPQMRRSAASTVDQREMLQQSKSLKALHAQMMASLPLQRTTGAELVHYVMVSTLLAATESQAVAILSAMLEAGFLQAQTADVATASSDDDVLALMQPAFDELHTYTLRAADDVMTQSGSSYQLDVDVDNSSVHMTRPAAAAGVSLGRNDAAKLECYDEHAEEELAAHDVSFGFSASKDVELENSVLSTAGLKPLMEAFCDHEELLLNQLLAAEAIPPVWANTLLQLCAEVVIAFDPRQCGMMDLETPRRPMDIRHFVNFKKVPGGQPQDSAVCAGIAFTKDVVHKAMLARIDKPRVLLLLGAIDYQRVEGRFVSIETLLMQESEYLSNVTRRILQLRPQVVLVHRNCSGIAQDMLRAHGITLVLDVKLAVLERLARTLQCDIVESIDSNVGRPKLGTCERFRTRTFECAATGTRKTLMLFELQSVQRGCCVLLRGAAAELVRVKRVARMLLYARYNWRLELALLLNEFARPPSPKASIFDSKDHSPVDEELEEAEPEPEARRCAVPETVAQCAHIAAPPAGNVSERRETGMVTKENVQDFSDPLRAIDLSPSAFDQESSVEFAVEMPYDNRFRTALSSTVLSVSPFVAFPLPYLETEAGRKCELRSRFPSQLYYSKQLQDDGGCSGTSEKPPPPATSDCIGASCADTSAGRPTHPFLTHKITTSIRNRDMQAMLASFRASGGRLPAKPMMKKMPHSNENAEVAAATCGAGPVQRTPDALDIDNHQRLFVLFCSFHANPKPAATFCTPPSLLRMTFYGEQDIMLGQFLDDYCFRRSYVCSSCKLPMLHHVRRFVHSMGCVQLKLVEDQSTVDSEQVLMMSWCGICHAWTPTVPISVDTWCLSFAKYLEHRFHGHAYRRRTVDAAGAAAGSAEQSTSGPCTHSMHRDYVQFFSFNGIVASFVYTPLQPWSLRLPATVRSLRPAAAAAAAAASGDGTPDARHLEEVKRIGQAGYEVFARIYDRLATLAADTPDTSVPALASLKPALNRDQLAFRDRIGMVQTLLTETNSGGGGGGSVWDVQDALWGVKRSLAENIEQWTARLNEAFAAAALVSTSSSSGPLLQSQRSIVASVIDAGTICTEDLCPDSPGAFASADRPTATAADAAPAPPQQRRMSDQPEAAESANQSPTRLSAGATDAAVTMTPVRSDVADKKSVKTILRELLPSDKPAAIGCCIPSPLPSGEHYCLSTAGKFPVTVHDLDLSSVIAFALVSHDYKRTLDARQQPQLPADGSLDGSPVSAAAASAATVSGATAATAGSSGANASPMLVGPRKSYDGSQDGDAEQREPAEKKRNSSAAAHIEVAFSDSSTSFTCKTYFAREFDTLRASLIATGAHSANASPNKADGEAADAADPEHRRKVSHSLSVPSADDVDEVRGIFARSLCRSEQWEARGGKSGSKFCKSMDDRFVLKEMSRLDVSIFENFAPKYFEYVAQCLRQDKPTLLAKIFGVYRVTIKKKDSVVDKSLLVMENLFYDSDITKKYDLKGSDRNRLVNPNEFSGEHVLLDENLIKNSWSQPLYILRHSQSVLFEALNRDVSFLERNDVMDYSLLVGLNSNDRVLVLGIIDYIRTFTLDKRIESMVKKSGLMGGQGKLPTVISPKQYKQRFLEAMERYFLTVPDRWEELEQNGQHGCAVP